MNWHPTYRWRDRERTRTRRRAFTLVELLVVIFIILLVSALTLPTIIPAVSNRQVSEAARLVQAALAGARDAAIRADGRRGIRLIPDPTLNSPVLPAGNPIDGLFHPGILTYSRLIPIESGPDYSDGAVSIIADFPVDVLAPGAAAGTPNATLPYTNYPVGSGFSYPSGVDFSAGTPVKGKVLRVEECAYYVLPSGIPVPNAPTNWWWNIRVGDKIQINGAGRYYTVVGPLTIFPTAANGGVNSELFVNNGAPGTLGSIVRTYGTGNNAVNANVEFLYVVNGQDDDNDGYVNDGFDGIDNDYANKVDDATPTDALHNPVAYTGNPAMYGEWETETWLGTLAVFNNSNPYDFNRNPIASPGPIYSNDQSNPGFNLPYTIARRPVVSPGARETVLPGSVVIDASTWNVPNPERSRLPIDLFSMYVDILVNQSGAVIPTTTYSSLSSNPITASFYHLWLTDRTDVYEPTPYDPKTVTNPFPRLPMPKNFGTPTPPSPNVLKKDRQLVTLFVKSGQIVTKSIETFHPPLAISATDPGDPNAPFYESQLGIREAK